MSSYTFFARYYDILTSNIPYKKRGEYFNALIKRLNKDAELLVDLACGTGSLSEVMASLGYDVIGVDSSPDMLSVAMNKKYISGSDILYLCQDMRELDLYNKADIIICALDSLNHITNSKDVQTVFNRVSLFLQDDGFFVFDVNTVYKHTHILSNNTFVYDFDEVYCVWQNSPCEKNIIDISLDFFVKNKNNTYNKYEENFKERAYSHIEILDFINKSSLKLIDYFAEDSVEKPVESTQRIVYVVKKTK